VLDKDDLAILDRGREGFAELRHIFGDDRPNEAVAFAAPHEPYPMLRNVLELALAEIENHRGTPIATAAGLDIKEELLAALATPQA